MTAQSISVAICVAILQNLSLAGLGLHDPRQTNGLCGRLCHRCLVADTPGTYPFVALVTITHASKIAPSRANTFSPEPTSTARCPRLLSITGTLLSSAERTPPTRRYRARVSSATSSQVLCWHIHLAGAHIVEARSRVYGSMASGSSSRLVVALSSQLLRLSVNVLRRRSRRVCSGTRYARFYQPRASGSALHKSREKDPSSKGL